MSDEKYYQWLQFLNNALVDQKSYIAQTLSEGYFGKQIVLWDNLEYYFWTPNGILEEKLGPSKIFAHYGSALFAHFE